MDWEQSTQRIGKQRIRATALARPLIGPGSNGNQRIAKQQKIYRHGKQRRSNISGQQRICAPIDQLRIGKQGTRATDLGPNRTFIGPGNNGKQRIRKQRTGAIDLGPNGPLTALGSNGKQRIRDHLPAREATGSNGKPGIGKQRTRATDVDPRSNGKQRIGALRLLIEDPMGPTAAEPVGERRLTAAEPVGKLSNDGMRY